MQYTENIFVCQNENFQWKNSDIFLIFAQKMDYGYTLESMFWSKKIRKIGVPLHTPALLYKSGV